MSMFRVEIDRSAIAENFATLQGRIGKVCAVVKCDAYGHGLADTVKALSEAGCNDFAVAASEEAVTVRRLAPKAWILLLSGADASDIPELADANITLTLFSSEYAEMLKNTSQKVRLHLKTDVGMNRTGFSTDEIPNDVFGLRGQIDGVYTHFPRAENIAETTSSLARFKEFSADLEHVLGRNLLKHASASAAAILIPQSRLDVSRIGLALYGVLPFAEPANIGKWMTEHVSQIKLRPAMRVSGRVISVRCVKKGGFIGYGEHFRAEHDMAVATVFGGYAHGISRSCANRLIVSIGRHDARICGVPCMDRTMFDVTQIFDSGDKVLPGDEAVFVGKGRQISGFAKACGTIPYEALCRFGGNGIEKRTV